MSEILNYELPIHVLSDGCKFIALRDVVEIPEAAAFVSRFSNYWRWDHLRCGYVSAPQH